MSTSQRTVVLSDAPNVLVTPTYARFALAGAICCAVTHGALTPVDVVKTRIQLDPITYNKGMVDGFRKVIQQEGAAALLTGVGPTFAGYFLQGAFKFGGYEYWKNFFIDQVGVQNAVNNRVTIYLTSAAIAEFFADVALCPLEATRIRLVSQPTFARGLTGGFVRLYREEGFIKGFYSGFIPILFKQVPYTMTKFAVQEKAAELLYSAIGKTKKECSNLTNSGMYLTSGVIAGAAAAVVSQPADTLLSKVNKQKGVEGVSMLSRLATLSAELGPRGLFLGLGPRIVMVGTLTAFQFAIYGDIKRIINATGSAEIAKITK